MSKPEDIKDFPDDIQKVIIINPFPDNSTENKLSTSLLKNAEKWDPNNRYEMTDSQAYSLIKQNWQRVKLVERHSESKVEPELYQYLTKDLLNNKNIAILYLKFPGILDYEAIDQSSRNILEHLKQLSDEGFNSVLIPDIREADLRTTNIPGLIKNAPALTGIFGFEGLSYILDVNSKLINFINNLMSARESVQHVVVKAGLPDAIRTAEVMINGNKLGKQEQIRLV